MIKCNLNVLLAEREMKVTELSEKTGISRVTLNQLRYNQGKGIQFETMNTLCEHLGVTPGDMFTHINFSVQVINKIELAPNQHSVDLVIKIDNDVIEDTVKVRVSNKAGKPSYKFTAPQKTFDKLAMLSRAYVRYELYSALYSSLVDSFDSVDVELVREE